MCWNDVNLQQLSHFQRLGKIRRENKVIGTGRQCTIDTHTCVRYNDKDKLIIRVKPIVGQNINLSGEFADGDKIIELYTGQTSVVSNGMASFPRYENNIAIIKKY